MSHPISLYISGYSLFRWQSYAVKRQSIIQREFNIEVCLDAQPFWGRPAGGAPGFFRQSCGVAQFWRPPVLVSLSFGVPQFWRPPVLPSPSFAVPQFCRPPVLASPSFGVPQFWCRPILVSPNFDVLSIFTPPESSRVARVKGGELVR